MKETGASIHPLLKSLPTLATVATLAFAAGAETPAKVDAGAAAVGKATYRSYCASCHGAEAKGDGPVAEYLTIRPTDLTQLTKKDGEFPFQKTYEVIDGREKRPAHGSRDMPIWGEAFAQTPGGETEEGVNEKITQLVHFLWSIQE